MGMDPTGRDKAEQERFEAHERLRHAQKLEAIGLVTSGVAHDFNNLLTVILSYSILIDQALPEGDPLHEDAREIIKASKRAAVLTNQLLTFSRQKPVHYRPLQIDMGLSHPKNMLRRLIPESIIMHIDPPNPNLYSVLADENQLEQVVVNLTVNARDAMPNGGTVWIRLNNVTLSADEAVRLEVTPGEYVALQVKDTGVGIPEDIKDKLFDPFFTTKAVGKGTGLGLSTVYGIVRQNGGAIQVDSELGKGATFTVYFPRYTGV